MWVLEWDQHDYDWGQTEVIALSESRNRLRDRAAEMASEGEPGPVELTWRDNEHNGSITADDPDDDTAAYIIYHAEVI